MGRWALLKIGSMCDNNCIFCHRGGPLDDSSLSIREVCRRVLAAREAGYSGIVLSGGEPTAHPQALTIARFITKAGLDLGLITNGRTLSQTDVREAWIASGLRMVHLSLHGSCSEIHDSLAGVSSFDETFAVLQYLVSNPGIQLSVNTIVSKKNLSDIKKTSKLIEETAHLNQCTKPLHHRLALIEPKGRAFNSIELLPQLRDAAEAVSLVCSTERCSNTIVVGHDGFPLCLAPPRPAPWLNLKFYGITAMQEPDERQLFPVDESRRGFGRQCLICGARTQCPGIYIGYLKKEQNCLSPLHVRQESS